MDAYGYSNSMITAEAIRRGTPILSEDQLKAQEGSFDVLTAIEVIEHAVDPLSMLRQVRKLLRPGGLFFLTTGNARPLVARLTGWSYVNPDVHMSCFEPLTLEVAMRKAGFRPERMPSGPAFDLMSKFKMLQSLRIRERNQLTDILPSSLVGPIVEHLRHPGEQPVGWAQ